MRRKSPPSPLAHRSGVIRSLRPVAFSKGLPTAASLLLAVAAIGCSTPTLETIAADPGAARAKTPEAPPAPAPAPSASAYIEPLPGDVDGEIPYVKPRPVPPTKPAH